MGAFGQFDNGPIQFNHDSGAIEARGTIDRPGPATTTAPAAPGVTAPAASPTGGGVLPDAGVSRMSAPDTPLSQPDLAATFQADSAPARTPARIGDNVAGFRPIGSTVPGFQPIGSSYTDIANVGVSGLDDGGEVDGPVGAAQGADAATLDPMGMFKSVLSFGRKSMGLPTNFESGQSDEQAPQSQGFDNGGGVLPMDDDQGGGEQQGGDDVTAGGNSLPDPRSTMRYLTGDGAVSPEVANALEQHIDPQRQMPQSERTMAAIQKAPSPEAKFGMMQHYRTLFNGFAGGAAAAASRGDLAEAANNATKAFSHVPTGKEIQFAPAGNGKIAVMAKGLRAVIGSGPMGQAPLRAGDDAWEKYHGSGGSLSMDAGGEVPDDDDNEDQGVLPAQSAQPRADTTDSVLQEHAAMDDQYEQSPTGDPVLLDPNQFKALVQSGYDAPVEGGWEKFINDALGKLGPSSAQAAPQQPYAAAPGGTLANAARKVNGETPEAPAAPGGPAQPQEGAPAAEKKGPDFEEGDAKYQHMLDRAEKLANKLFPWASQQDQRSAYVGHMMDQYGQNEGKIDLAKSNGKLQMEQVKEQGRNARADSAHQSRESIARQKELWTTMRADKQNLVRSAGQMLVADPTIARDPQRMTDFLKQQADRIGIHPEDLRGLIQNGISANAPATGGAGQGAGGQPSGANQSAAKPGDTKPYTKNGVTKQYKFGTDGMWHLAQ